MKNLNKMTDFDKQWKDVFENAEMSPPEGVWDKIDASLSKEEAGYFKKRAFIFKLLAAASIAFALGVSIFSINYFLNDETNQVVVQDTENPQIPMNSIEAMDESGDNQASANTTVVDDINGTNEPSKSEKGDGKAMTVKEEDSNYEHGVVANIDSKDGGQNESGSSTIILTDNSNEESNLIPVEVSESRSNIELNELLAHGIYMDSGDDMIYTIDHIYLIPIIPSGIYKNRKKEPVKGAFLAGLDFSTGIFDPNFQQGNNVFASTAGANFSNARVESVNDQYTSLNTANKDFLLVRSAGQENKPEVSYSYGANFGFKVSRRFLLQTGIAYRKANSTITTTGYFEDVNTNTQIPIVASHHYQMDGLSAVKTVPETSLNNQYEFASIPLRAGYIALDRKVNVTFLAGISSELFLSNQIGGNENFETLSSSSGKESPYKSVYFNGSLGTMLGYNFAKNYLITVEPSYRFAVNSFTQNDFYLNSYPSSFMVSFGVAYNFK